MCVAFPGKVVNINGKTAQVDFSGNELPVKIGLVDVKVGDYVLVHAGYAMEAMSEDKAKVLLETFAEVNEAAEHYGQ